MPMLFHGADATADIYVTRGRHLVTVTHPDSDLKNCLPHLDWLPKGGEAYTVPYSDIAEIFMRGLRITDASDLTFDPPNHSWDHFCVHPQVFGLLLGAIVAVKLTDDDDLGEGIYLNTVRFSAAFGDDV